ncbi:MAG: hypothetical protein ACRDTF_05125, partial [Pseudonocardiaceae bacterium]
MPADLTSGAVLLVRYRPGVSGTTARTIHLVPVPVQAAAAMVSALCGALLSFDDIEIVQSDEGMPCTACLL